MHVFPPVSKVATLLGKLFCLLLVFVKTGVQTQNDEQGGYSLFLKDI